MGRPVDPPGITLSSGGFLTCKVPGKALVLYAFKLRPTTTSDGVMDSYLGVSEDGLWMPVTAHDDAQALRELAAHQVSGDLVCEERLAAAGIQLGFTAGSAPDTILARCAEFALEHVLGTVEAPKKLDLLLEFARSAAAFWRSPDPPGRLQDQLIVVEVTGSVERSPKGMAFADVQGRTGVTLFERFLEDELIIIMEPKPDICAMVLEAAFGLDRVPTLMRTRGEEETTLAYDDVLVVTAVLRALADITPEVKNASAEVTIGEMTVKATATTEITKDERAS